MAIAPTEVSLSSTTIVWAEAYAATISAKASIAASIVSLCPLYVDLSLSETFVELLGCTPSARLRSHG